MTEFGYTLFSELNGPKELVHQAQQAEDVGFDFAVISDHFHPWLSSHTDSPFAWSVLGAVAERTSSMKLATLVTCPMVRYHPAIIAQAVATIQIMSDGRFTLSVGAGENLNEHVVGRGWPAVDVRHEMLGRIDRGDPRSMERRLRHLPREARHGRGRADLFDAR